MQQCFLPACQAWCIAWKRTQWQTYLKTHGKVYAIKYRGLVKHKFYSHNVTSSLKIPSTLTPFPSFQSCPWLQYIFRGPCQLSVSPQFLTLSFVLLEHVALECYVALVTTDEEQFVWRVLLPQKHMEEQSRPKAITPPAACMGKMAIPVPRRHCSWWTFCCNYCWLKFIENLFQCAANKFRIWRYTMKVPRPWRLVRSPCGDFHISFYFNVHIYQQWIAYWKVPNQIRPRPREMA